MKVGASQARSKYAGVGSELEESFGDAFWRVVWKWGRLGYRRRCLPLIRGARGEEGWREGRGGQGKVWYVYQTRIGSQQRGEPQQRAARSVQCDDDCSRSQCFFSSSVFLGGGSGGGDDGGGGVL